jgi:hypothetical protein
MAKPRIIKDFEKLDVEIQEQIKLSYPTGFFEHLVSYVDRDGNEQWALPFETEEKYYLVRMSVAKAKKLINEDDDYDDNGILRNDIQEMYQEKYTDGEIEYLGDDFDGIETPANDIVMDIKNEMGVDDDDDDDDEDANKKSTDDFDDEDDDDYEE